LMKSLRQDYKAAAKAAGRKIDRSLWAASRLVKARAVELRRAGLRPGAT